MCAVKEHSRKLLTERYHEAALDTIVSRELIKVEVDFISGGYSQ